MWACSDGDPPAQVPAPAPVEAPAPPAEPTVEELRAGAEAGDRVAIYNLGVHAFTGRGMPQDHAEARRLWTRAAELGDIDAASNLAYLLYNGLGGERDPEAALRWGLAAAEAGHPEAPLHVALFYVEDDGIPPDPVETLAWAEVARVRAERLGEAGYTERALALGGAAMQQLSRAQADEALKRADERLKGRAPAPRSSAPR